MTNPLCSTFMMVADLKFLLPNKLMHILLFKAFVHDLKVKVVISQNWNNDDTVG